MRLLLPALLLAAVAVCSSALTVAELRPCNVSLFAESFLVVLGKYGITWVDGRQESLEHLNVQLDDRLNDVANHKDHVYALRWDSAKLFYSANYSHVIVTGINFNWDEEKFRRFQIGVLDARDLDESKYNGHRGWNVVPEHSHYYQFCVETPGVLSGPHSFVEGDEAYSDKWQKICDSKTVTFIPNEHRFVFDGDKSMSLEIFGDHPTYKSPKVENIPETCGKDVFRIFYIDDFYPRMCKDNMLEGVPNEMVADFHNKLQIKFGNLYDESKKKNWAADAFFFNQLESGKFKLQAELVNVNGAEFYYHVLTRLDRYELIEEVEKCYVRKFKKEEVKDKFKRDDQPLEFPRMLIIPKESGPNGVVMSLIANPTTTTTSTTTTTCTTTSTTSVTTTTTTTPTSTTTSTTLSTSTSTTTEARVLPPIVERPNYTVAAEYEYDDPDDSNVFIIEEPMDEDSTNLSAKIFCAVPLFATLFLMSIRW